MKIQIHPVAHEAEYTELLLSLLVQAGGLTEGLELSGTAGEQPA